MTTPPLKKFSKNMRAFSLGGENDDVLIEALAPVEGIAGEFRRVAFKASLVDMLVEMDADISGIVLKSGVTIPVALRFPELKNRIYNNDASTGNSIDLSLVSGKAVKDVLAVRLSKEFNPAAEEAKAVSTGATLDIIAFAHRQASDREFKRLVIPEDKIGFFEPHRARKGAETFIRMKPGYTVDGWNEFYVALPITHFTYYIKEARDAGQDSVNLMEASRPKTTDTLRMD